MAPRLGHVFKPLKDRLLEKVEYADNGCWIWRGATNGSGYGKISVGHDGREYAHRAAYRAFRCEIPEGMQLDHLCRTPSCINPCHLEPVTNAENTKRGKVSALRPLRTECKRGHPVSGRGLCRECQKMSQAAYRMRKNNVHA